jgi:hypothetical protein
VLYLLVDTSVWLDLAKRRDGQRAIVPIRVFRSNGELELLVPTLVLEEFSRNRERVAATMSASVAERFRLLRKDIIDWAGEDRTDALAWLDGLAHQLPLIGAMTTRNFTEILAELEQGQRLEANDDERARVVERGLQKRAPFRRQKNSVADALLIEQYATAIAAGDLNADVYCFVTANSDDFSLPGGNRREPHPDIAELFEHVNSRYFYGVDGLIAALR